MISLSSKKRKRIYSVDLKNRTRKCESCSVVLRGVFGTRAGLPTFSLRGSIPLRSTIFALVVQLVGKKTAKTLAC